MKKEEPEWSEFVNKLLNPKYTNVEDLKCGNCR